MTTTDTQHGAQEAPQSSDDATDPGAGVEEQAQDILAKARYEAFRLMTDARTEAEEILEQARTEADAIRKEAELTAESIVDAAHMQSDEIRSKPKAPEPDESVAQLEQEHEELTQRVSSLRSLADQLEERFAALAENAQTPRPEITEPPRPVLDYSPSVPPPPKATAEPPTEETDATETFTSERGSFYSRRSAKLPRIGDAGGHSALDMMRSIRETFDDS